MYFIICAFKSQISRNVQFIFTGDRKKSLDIIPRLIHLGDRLWNVDIQYYLDHELGIG